MTVSRRGTGAAHGARRGRRATRSARPGTGRRALAVITCLAVFIGFGMTGCAASAPATRPTIGFVAQTTNIGYARELSDGFRAGAQIAGGVDSVVTGPPTPDPAQQVTLFGQLTGTARGGIVAAPSAPELFSRPLADAVDSGIPVIAVATRLAPGSGVRLLVEGDNYALGELMADEAIARLPAQATGKVILGTNQPALNSLDQRAKGIRDRFAQRLPNVRVMGPFDTQLDAPSNLSAWQVLVAANPDAMAFLGTGDIDAVNLATIRGRTGGTWLAAGYSLDPEALRAVQDGRLFAVVSPEHFLTAEVAAWLLAEHAKDPNRRLPEGWLATPGLAVTPDNVGEIIQRQSSEANKVSWFRPWLDRMTTDPAGFLRPLDQAR
jgi:ribose transport system substrate-binding protein